MLEEEAFGIVDRYPSNVLKGVVNDKSMIEVHAMWILEEAGEPWNNSYCWQLCEHEVEESDVLPDGINQVIEMNVQKK